MLEGKFCLLHFLISLTAKVYGNYYDQGEMMENFKDVENGKMKLIDITGGMN